MTFNDLLKSINENDSIIILRHSRPDLDALGSQLGLKKVLEYNYPNKKIYAVGDYTEKYRFIGDMDNVSDEIFEKSLVIVVDVAVTYMICDERYKLAKEVWVIDHHNNPCDLTDKYLIDPTRVAAAEYIASLLMDANIKIPASAATCLYGGIITDGGRFMYGNDLARTLNVSAELIKLGADFKYIYNNIYVESLESKKMNSYFANQFQVKEGVAWLKNDASIFDKFPVEFNDISRGALSVMSGIKEIEIWLNFTYDKTKGKVIGEFRSRKYPIVELAIKYGGGGHENACGATLDDFSVADKFIDECIKYLKECHSNEQNN